MSIETIGVEQSSSRGGKRNVDTEDSTNYGVLT